MLGLALVKKIIPVISSVFDAEVYAEKILNHVGVRLGLSDTYFPNFYFANERFVPIESDTKLAIFPFFGDPIFWKMGDDWPEVIGGTSNVIDLDTIAQAVPAKVVHAIKAYSEEWATAPPRLHNLKSAGPLRARLMQVFQLDGLKLIIAKELSLSIPAAKR